MPLILPVLSDARRSGRRQPAGRRGHMAMRETSSGRRGGHGLAVTGLVLGYVTLVPWIAFWSMVLLGAVSAPFTTP